MAAPRFVGIGFRKQQGKDTFANMLATHLFKMGAVVHRDSFAAALKDEVEAYGVDRALIDGDEEARATLVKSPTGEMVTVRYLLQWWGSEYRRAGDPDYWLDPVMCRPPRILLPPYRQEFVIVSDVRFLNELEAMDYTCAVRRRGHLAEKDPHKSENALKYDMKWDAIIENDAGLSCLDLNAELVAQHLFEGTPLAF